ncbi:MAG: alcohol phosphatidyltransferase [Propionibacteriales bacterium]|nr:alcohol phosphatidyltransferase [Propionibacteriales bacterium]
MRSVAQGVEVAVDPRGVARPERETLRTAANAVTGVRTVAAVALAMLAAREESLGLLLASLAVYWVGDIADGTLARLTDHETRIGATLDILSDRFCAGAFYVGLAWLEPGLALPIAIYLAEFMVVDAFLSLAFLAWPIVSPNYFYVVDHKLWLWNWSKLGKAVNSAAFAILLVVTESVWLGTAVALALLTLKVASLVRLGRLGLPVPSGS